VNRDALAVLERKLNAELARRRSLGE
jgi:hypothetical protein